MRTAIPPERDRVRGLRCMAAMGRVFPDLLLILKLGYDAITDDAQFGARLQPVGF